MQINEKAPVVQRNQIHIQAAPAHVWAILTNIHDWPTWNNKISAAHLESQLVAGGKFVWKINGATIHSTLHTLQLHRAFGWSGTTFGATAIHNWYLADDGNGGTLVNVEESMDGWLVALFKNKMNRDLAKDMLFWLDMLEERAIQAISK